MTTAAFPMCASVLLATALLDPPPRCGLALGMPEGARRVTVDAETGAPTYLLRETLSATLSTAAAWEHWLVVPDGGRVPRVLQMAIPLEVTARVPQGELRLTAIAFARARDATGRLEGLPARLCFDPRGKGGAAYPWPAPIAAARARGLLRAEQEARLAAVEEHLEAQRLPALARAWDDFVASTYEAEGRRRLVEELLLLRELPPGVEAASLSPARFLDRAQRVPLRALGHVISGQCTVKVRGREVSLLLKDCPLSQAASEWNRVVTEGKRLVAGGPRRHEELDLVLETSQALDVARAALLAVPGLASSAEQEDHPLR